MMRRVFDTMKGEERDCSDPENCEPAVHFEYWGDKMSSGGRDLQVNSVYIANATEFGLFIYEASPLRIVRSVFDWETLLSNVCTWWILHRWALAQVLMLASAIRGRSYWCGVGISSVCSSKSFFLLPLVSLPRLKMTFAAFWTVGCAFEGQQGALAEAWFAVYPAIAHFILIYYSILNLLAKALRRRVSDVLFTPTVVALCLLHYFRLELAISGWLRGIDGRVATVVFSDEAKQMQLADYFTTDISWRMNGRVSLVFYAKLGILVVNLMPLLFSQSFPIDPHGAHLDLSGVEKALALNVKRVGGLGTWPPYIQAVIDARRRSLSSATLQAFHSRHFNSGQTSSAPGPGKQQIKLRVKRSVVPIDSPGTKPVGDQHVVILVSSFELIRLGYLVFGDAYVTTFQEYGRICAMAPLRAFFHLWNHRVLVWTLRPEDGRGDAEIAGGRALESTEPQMWRLDDPRLRSIRWWQVSACSVQC
jgi:hypothetical protein